MAIRKPKTEIPALQPDTKFNDGWKEGFATGYISGQRILLHNREQEKNNFISEPEKEEKNYLFVIISVILVAIGLGVLIREILNRDYFGYPKLID